MDEANRRDDASELGSDANDGDVDSIIDDDDVEDEDNVQHLGEEDDGCPILDRDALLKIKNEDPDVTSIDIRDFDLLVDREDAGLFIGRSPHIRKLLIKGESMAWEEDYLRTSFLLGRFCKGLVRNRSIEHLMVRCCDLSVGDASVTDPRLKKLQQFSVLRMSQFFQQNSNLRYLRIECCALGNKSTRVLAMVLGRKADKGSLERINLYANDIDDLAAEELITSLKGYDNLVEISMGNNFAGARACAALKDLVSSPTASLRELNLQNNHVDDKGIASLAAAFQTSATLEEVDLGFNFNVTRDGWLRFFTHLRKNPPPSIEHLDLGANRIADREIAALGSAMANNSTLRALDFTSKLPQLAPVTAAGWRSFFSALENSESGLRDLLLGGCQVDGEGLDVIVNALRVNVNPSLKILDLSRNRQASDAVWSDFFAACLERTDPSSSSSSCSLEGLFLCKDLGPGADDLLADLARALRNNDALEAIDLGENPHITGEGWSHLSRLLCDDSGGARSVRDSNHAVNYLGPQDLPGDLGALAELNRHEDKGEVTRVKILLYHLHGGEKNMREFLEMDLRVLPRAISWLGRDCSWLAEGERNRARTPLYQLLRSMPSLFEFKNAPRGTKRKSRRLE